MLKNEKEKFYSSIIVILFISGFLIWQGIFSVKTDIENNINEIKNKKILISAYSFKEKILPTEIQSHSFFEEKVKKIDNYFVYANDNDDTEFSYFFSQLDNIATKATSKENSLTISLYQQEDPLLKKSSGAKSSFAKTSDKEDSRSLKLVLKSDFEGLLTFISYLEAMPYYVYIESVNINNINVRSEVKNSQNDTGKEKTSENIQSIIIIKVFKR